MKVSLITVSHNSANTIRDTFDSVLNQTYKDIEYIVVDGFSQDGTVSIIREYEPEFARRMCWISEPDKGLYDAMNKGIKMASGEIVGIINSDDFYHRNDTIERIVSSFIEDKTIEIIFGDVRYVNSTDLERTVRYYSSKKFNPSLFRFGFMPHHQTFFTYRYNYERIGLYQIDYKITADFELLIRFLYKNRLKYKYLNFDFLKMRNGGISTRPKNHLLLNQELVRSCRANGIYTNMLIIYMKYFLKIFEFVFTK
ncbi:MAG: glycosyltransferase [Tannerellaceae bacterium]|jgi:glycosyltransferase involved in cell wall biosynthesis|nr:glycosyltransferase [Tannerellaceae bacterium]